MNKREQELEMMLWFSENELYSDGGNVQRWFPRLKRKIEATFEIKLSNDANEVEDE